MTQSQFDALIVSEIQDITAKIAANITTNGNRLITGAKHALVENDAKQSLSDLATALKNSVFFIETHTTTHIVEGSNLFFTQARSRQSISSNSPSIAYDSSTGAISEGSGYTIPTDTQIGNFTEAYNASPSALSFNTSTGVLTFTKRDNSVIQIPLSLAPFTTNNLAEGGSNLYYTQNRVDARIDYLKPQVSAIPPLSLTASSNYTPSDITALIAYCNTLRNALQAAKVTA